MPFIHFLLNILSATAIHRILFILLFILSFSNSLYSQRNVNTCPINAHTMSATPYYPVTKTDTLKALIIYVRYQDDNFWCCQDWPPELWDIPSWGHGMLTPMGSAITDHPSLSGYFDAMSSSNGEHGWQLRGDEYPYLYVTKHPIAYYFDHRGLGAVAEEVLTNLDTSINYADYDRYDPSDIDHDGNIREPDGYVDMVIIWFRWLNSWVDGSTFQGVCALGGLSMSFPNGIIKTNDNVLIHGGLITEKISPDGPGNTATHACGLLAEGTSGRGIDIFVHELGHYMFGYFHTQHLGFWNLMTGNGVGIMNALERSDLGWIPYPHYYTTQYGTYNIHLEDFETTGDAYFFNTNTDGYILENRGTNGFYSAKANWIMPGNGLLITNLKFSTGAYEDPYTIACANHKWDWAFLDTNACETAYCVNMHKKKFTNPFKQLLPSNSGYSYMEMHDVCTSDGFNEVCKSYDSCAGSQGNLWTMGYNQVFSQWSNPKTALAFNGKPILIELISQNKDGSMDLLVKFGVDNCEVGTHPSEPVGLSMAKFYFDPNKPTRFHPRIDWFKNGEPDVNDLASPGRYNIYRGFVTNPKADPEYYFIQSVPADINSFIDYDIALYDPGNSVGCAYEPRTYAYRITVTDNENLESVRSERALVTGYIDPCEISGDSPIAGENNKDPLEFKVFNYPNPFNPSTEIKYTIPADAYVTLKIFNTLGQEVITLVNNEFKKAGIYSIEFDGKNLASGIYFYKFTAGQYNASKKMLLIK